MLWDASKCVGCQANARFGSEKRSSEEQLNDIRIDADGSEEEDETWLKPSVEEALQYRNNVRVTDDKNENKVYPLNTSVLEDETAVLGSGVQLYLKFLKFFSMVLLQT